MLVGTHDCSFHILLSHNAKWCYILLSLLKSPTGIVNLWLQSCMFSKFWHLETFLRLGNIFKKLVIVIFQIMDLLNSNIISLAFFQQQLHANQSFPGDLKNRECYFYFWLTVKNEKNKNDLIYLLAAYNNTYRGT